MDIGITLHIQTQTAGVRNWSSSAALLPWLFTHTGRTTTARRFQDPKQMSETYGTMSADNDSNQL